VITALDPCGALPFVVPRQAIELTPTFLTSGVTTTYATMATPDSAVTADDLLLGMVLVQGNTNDVALPSGWNLVARVKGTTVTTTIIAWALGDVADAGAAWTASGGSIGNSVVTAYSGVDLSNPILEVQSIGGGTSSITIPTCTYTGNAVVVGVHAARGASIIGHVPSLTARRRLSESSVDNNIGFSDSNGKIAAPGSTAVVFGSATNHVAAHVALRAGFA
jgi:hypothetical protein